MTDIFEGNHDYGCLHDELRGFLERPGGHPSWEEIHLNIYICLEEVDTVHWYHNGEA